MNEQDWVRRVNEILEEEGWFEREKSNPVATEFHDGMMPEEFVEYLHDNGLLTKIFCLRPGGEKAYP